MSDGYTVNFVKCTLPKTPAPEHAFTYLVKVGHRIHGTELITVKAESPEHAMRRVRSVIAKNPKYVLSDLYDFSRVEVVGGLMCARGCGKTARYKLLDNTEVKNAEK
jgi:hypothetical protein